MHLWVVIIDEVEVDPQLPHALKGISEPQTEETEHVTVAGWYDRTLGLRGASSPFYIGDSTLQLYLGHASSLLQILYYY